MIIEKINKFTESIRKTTENEDKMRKLSETFRGLFSIIHIVTTAISSGLKIAFQVLKGILSAFNIDVLDFTSMIGNAIYAVDRWITENNFLVEAVKTADRGVHRAVEIQLFRTLTEEKGMRFARKLLCLCLHEHLHRAIRSDHLIAPPGELPRHGAGAAAQIEKKAELAPVGGEFRFIKIRDGGIRYVPRQAVIPGGERVIAVHFSCSFRRSNTTA